MAKKKLNNARYHKHYFYHTRSGFYALVGTALVLGFGALIIWR